MTDGFAARNLLTGGKSVIIPAKAFKTASVTLGAASETGLPAMLDQGEVKRICELRREKFGPQFVRPLKACTLGNQAESF